MSDPAVMPPTEPAPLPPTKPDLLSPSEPAAVSPNEPVAVPPIKAGLVSPSEPVAVPPTEVTLASLAGERRSLPLVGGAMTPPVAGGGAASEEPGRRKRLGRRAQILAGASVSYNLVEAVVAISAGSVAGSVALVGFGLDSVVEVASGLIILWQFRHPLPETRERRALRLIALSFFGLAAYVGFESARGLLGQHESDTSGIGIGLAIASLVVMPLLSYAQRRTGKALNSNAVVADSTQTLLCTYLSAVLLIGLLLNATLGWYWADPIAGLVIAAIALREGIQAWQGKGCCAPTAKSTCNDGCC
jgi:hypothetical protein